MISRKLFSAAFLYLILQWLAGLVRGIPLLVVAHADGDQDGLLVHRYIQIDWNVPLRGVRRARADMNRIPGWIMDTWRMWRREPGAFADCYRGIGFDLTGPRQFSEHYAQALSPEANDAGRDYRLEMQAEYLNAASSGYSRGLYPIRVVS